MLNKFNILGKTILQLRELIEKKIISEKELFDYFKKRIDKYNKQLNAFITVCNNTNKNKKKAASGLLAGIPIAVKDIFCTKGIRTTAASNVLLDYIPPYNSTVYQKLEDSGAILLGKTNMDAWGHGASSENTDFGPVKNPWDKTRVAGGSSGGNAAALITRMAVFGIGEDTGGSIRNPSTW